MIVDDDVDIVGVNACRNEVLVGINVEDRAGFFFFFFGRIEVLVEENKIHLNKVPYLVGWPPLYIWC